MPHSNFQVKCFYVLNIIGTCVVVLLNLYYQFARCCNAGRLMIHDNINIVDYLHTFVQCMVIVCALLMLIAMLLSLSK